MFVPHARVRLVGLREHTERRRRRVARRRLNCIEIIRMPCLLPTLGAILLGIFVMASGCMMSVLGYKAQISTDPTLMQNTTEIVSMQDETTYYTLKVMSYIGPMLMGIGLFVIIVAAVLYCEIMDKYVNIVPDKNSKKIGRDQLYKMIIEQFRKNYFRGIEVPLQKPHPLLRSSSMNKTLFKALSISTPAMLATPELTSPWKTRHKSPVPDMTIKESVKQKLMEWEEIWLKTSSLPNIRPAENVSTDIESTSDITREEYLKSKRMSKSCGHVPHVYNSVGEFSEVASSGLDNPAYLPDAEKEKLLKPTTAKLPDNYQSFENVKDPLNVQLVSVIVHKASIHTPPKIYDMQMKGMRAIRSFDHESGLDKTFVDMKQSNKCKSCIGLVSGQKSPNLLHANTHFKPRQQEEGVTTNTIAISGDMLRIFDMAEMAQV
ncbi:hypothetical protein LOTGIDRAFT_161162 [Lottia gigantea]|uniref:Uncharacterized protein n=1 Tax=Lottia gigantea TaxID=225164 RepID=V4ALK2_LOTGI|nr:hypothetical protein LOTGIDRAFT_161162 [Lottia gigantea]ESO94466.1 hypothetical protein LOTGIDRAFT_161162 [Lottia gigantea]